MRKSLLGALLGSSLLILAAASYQEMRSAPIRRARTAGHKATIYRNIDFGGEAIDISLDTPELPKPWYREGSSVKIENEDHKWTILWESKGFDQGDDQLWIEGSRTISDLHHLGRPHGNNHWGDRIEAVSFSDTGPEGDNDNRTVCRFGEGCINQPKFPGVPVHPGWFVRFCPRRMDASAIDLWVGSDNKQTEHWMVWRKDKDPVEIDFPIRYLFIFTVYLKGQAIPDGQQSSLCVGFQDHITQKYTFGHAEDHEPDQGEEDNCEC